MLGKNIVLVPLLLLSVGVLSNNKHAMTMTEGFTSNSGTFQPLDRYSRYKYKHNYHYANDKQLTKQTKIFNDDSRGGDTSSAVTYPSLSQKLMAETIGTFLIVHLGCGTVCSAIYHSAQIGLWQIAAVWSLAVTLAIYTTAHVSGAHLNPAISIAMKICRPLDHKDFKWGKVLLYCIAQTTGAALAAALNLALFWESIASFETKSNIVRGAANSIASASAFGEYWSVSSWTQAFLAEASGTFILSFMIFSLTNPRNKAVPDKFVPCLIGGTVGSLISVIAPLTQAGFNPARDFGPRLVSWFGGWGKTVAMQGWWVYVVGPIMGAIMGGLVAENILWNKDLE